MDPIGDEGILFLVSDRASETLWQGSFLMIISFEVVLGSMVLVKDLGMLVHLGIFLKIFHILYD